mmetsp:Transcript_36793/g.101190  ORF Transcript_36793/g.101190 Transcript_36793/m.101190 type:complete len:254 (+) Transcript_36793:255-1016(+)
MRDAPQRLRLRHHLNPAQRFEVERSLRRSRAWSAASSLCVPLWFGLLAPGAHCAAAACPWPVSGCAHLGRTFRRQFRFQQFQPALEAHRRRGNGSSHFRQLGLRLACECRGRHCFPTSAGLPSASASVSRRLQARAMRRPPPEPIARGSLAASGSRAPVGVQHGARLLRATHSKSTLGQSCESGMMTARRCLPRTTRAACTTESRSACGRAGVGRSATVSRKLPPFARAQPWDPVYVLTQGISGKTLSREPWT